MINAAGQKGFFSLVVNGRPYPLESITTDGPVLTITSEVPVRSGDNVFLSYSGGTMASVDRALLNDFSAFPVSNDLATPNFNPVPGKVEAEDFVTNFGTYPEYTVDVGGGSDVGWIDRGDYLDYALDVSASKIVYPQRQGVASSL